MNTTLHNLINGMLIITVMLLPLRAVPAIDHSDCTMHDSAHATAQHADHHHHMLQTGDQENAASKASCCCCDGGSGCIYGCEAGISTTVIIPPVLSVPPFNASSYPAPFENTLVSAELIPLTRPPARLPI